MPVYFVISRIVRTPQGYPIWQIVKVIRGDFYQDTDKVWDKHVRPLREADPSANWTIHAFVREPSNLFRDFKEE